MATLVWVGPALLGVGLAVLLLGVGLATVLLGVGLAAVLLGVSPGAGAAAGGAGKLVAMAGEIIEWRPPGGLTSLPAIVERQARPGCSSMGGPILFPLYVWRVVVTQAIYTYIIYISIPSL